MWRKKSGKKNKTWEGDGVAVFNGTSVTLKSESKQLFKTSCASVSEGDFLSAGMYECELGPVLEQAAAETPSKKEIAVSLPARTPIRPRPKVVGGGSLSDLLSAPLPKVGSAVKTPGKPPRKQVKLTPAAPITPAKSRSPEVSKPGANELAIDSELMQHLRPHQVEAVQFLYRAVTGIGHSHGSGALLGDEMGLGKTLTSIALIFGMLKSGLIKNCLVVCPVTLLRNWKNEFKKWLGDTRIGVFLATPDADVTNFLRTSFKTYQVMIAGYERMIKISETLLSGMTSFDLVICDEGHRLKGLNTKAAQVIASISGDRRIILTGTPVQNNLAEFYALTDYLNPGIFGSAAKFSRKFIEPMTAARRPDAPECDLVRGKEATQELVEIVNDFVIRRDFRVLEKYVQVPKVESVVFCRPFANQAKIYQDIISSRAISACMDAGGQGEVLKAVSMLRQAATSTLLVPEEWRPSPPPRTDKSGGKLCVLAEFLRKLSSATDEKVVIVSGSTATLDLVQTLCGNLELQWLRLDGSTPQDQRQQLVDLFNKTSHKRSFAFLLSARSGGAGLNLIGASRLVLLDSDWNPAIDIQAMARVFRDGQTRPVFIYRFLCTGTIDEKIFQRQLTKQGLSDAVLDLEPPPDRFTRDQLRDLFSLTAPKLCNTLETGPHDNLQLVEANEDEMLAACAGSISCVLRVL